MRQAHIPEDLDTALAHFLRAAGRNRVCSNSVSSVLAGLVGNCLEFMGNRSRGYVREAFPRQFLPHPIGGESRLLRLGHVKMTFCAPEPPKLEEVSACFSRTNTNYKLVCPKTLKTSSGTFFLAPIAGPRSPLNNHTNDFQRIPSDWP